MPNFDAYTVGWICAGVVEFSTARNFLDEKHSKKHNYTLGRIGKHNVVLALQDKSSRHEPTRPSRATENLLRDFTNLRICFLLSVGGGAPSQRHDIRLGDVLVGFTDHNTESVLHCDYRRTINKNKFTSRGILRPPSIVVQEAIKELRTEYGYRIRQIRDTVTTFFHRNPDLKLPSPNTDQLYVSSLTCARGNKSGLIPRSPRYEDDGTPVVHYGLIASGDRTIQDAELRDQLAAEKDILCFETEASRLMNHIPYLVICGIYNYCDAYRSTEWELYAALTAVAYGKDLLSTIPPEKVEAERKLGTILSDIQEDEMRIRIWLSPSDSSVNWNRALDRRHPNTCSWFLRHPRYLDWKLESNSFLWLTGIPGCGKTILISSVIEDLNKSQSSNLIYFYFDIYHSRQRTQDDMIRSLIIQLYEKRTDTRTHLDSLYSQCKKGLEQPSFELLYSTFRDIIQDAGELWMIIDAIDECATTNKDGVGEIISLIVELRRLQTDIHILVTSRQEQYIKATSTGSICPLSIFPILSDLIKKDIDAYIYSRISGSQRWRDSEPREIEKLLVERAGGMFRWVSYQIDELESSLSDHTPEQILASSPKGLDEIYIRILDNVPLPLRHRTIRLLQFLVYSKRSLCIKELADALAVELANVPQFSPLTRSADSEDIFRYCPGFIIGTDEKNDRSRIKISLAHHSIRKFLKSYMSTEDARAAIAEVCLAYLLQIEHNIPVKEVRQNYPLAQYAARYWADHAFNIEQRVQGLIMKLFEYEESFNTCYQLYSPDKPWRKNDEYEEPPPVLYYASLTGLAQSVQGLLDKGVNVNAHGGIYGNALQATSYKGHVEILSLLLDRGADINIKGGKYANAFEAALQAGHTHIVRALLDHGVNINVGDKIYSNTIQDIEWRKTHTDIVELLQKRGVNINTQELVYDSDITRRSHRQIPSIPTTLIQYHLARTT
ncbi:hypothetical protein F4806DRAFT_502000 [Annulohypoxylon nitens]|nr:hypothetical protein F4806DRAFT_502000 [Annulohypoxylon nitens]